MTEQQFETLLRQVLRPEIDPKDIVCSCSPHGKGHIMHIQKTMKKAAAVLAAVLILTTTAYASDFMNIKSLATTGRGDYLSESYQDMGKAMKKAGFEIVAPESFENGYSFRNVHVGETGAYDEHGKEQFTYMDLVVYYKNPEGATLSLFTHADLEELSLRSREPDMTRMIGDVQVDYQLDHYKFVPEDYELTPEDKVMLEQPGYYLSYGADTVIEQDNHSLTWVKDGVNYHILDSGAKEIPDTLFTMAEELILTE